LELKFKSDNEIEKRNIWICLRRGRF